MYVQFTVQHLGQNEPAYLFNITISYVYIQWIEQCESENDVLLVCNVPGVIVRQNLNIRKLTGKLKRNVILLKLKVMRYNFITRASCFANFAISINVVVRSLTWHDLKSSSTNLMITIRLGMISFFGTL